MSKIWSFMIVLSIVIVFLIGDPNIITSTIMNNSKSAVENVITLTGMLCFWSGIFKIFENTSMIDKLSYRIKLITKKLFNQKELSDDANKYISLNITSNILGLGNASTIHGVRAMEEMSSISKTSKPTDNMTKFVLLNTASIQIIPTSMIALRSLYNSNNSAGIIFPVWIVTLVSLAVGLTSIIILNKIIK